MKKLLLFAVFSLLLGACSGNTPSFKKKQNSVLPEAATPVIDEPISDIPLPPSPPSIPDLPSPPPLLDVMNPPVETAYSDTDPTVACTMDAKVCPDGSYVGRIPPNCDFEACPGTSEAAPRPKPQNRLRIPQ